MRGRERAKDGDGDGDGEGIRLIRMHNDKLCVYPSFASVSSLSSLISHLPSLIAYPWKKCRICSIGMARRALWACFRSARATRNKAFHPERRNWSKNTATMGGGRNYGNGRHGGKEAGREGGRQGGRMLDGGRGGGAGVGVQGV